MTKGKGNPDWPDFYEKVINAARKDRRALFEKYAKDHNMKFESVRVKFSISRRKANPAAIQKKMNGDDEAKIVDATVAHHEKAARYLDEAVAVFQLISKGGVKEQDRVSAAKGLMQASTAYLRAHGLITPGAPTTNNTLNLAVFANDASKLNELLGLWDGNDDALRALWAWLEPRAKLRGWR